MHASRFGRPTRRAALALPAAAWWGSAGAQTFPSRIITFVIPLTPGGPADTTARVVADKMSEQIGQQIIVDNMGGAAGMQALNRVARADPDGHTLLVGPGSFVTMNPLLTPPPHFDPVENFEPVTLISQYPAALFVNVNSPVRSLDDFIAFARGRSGKLNFSSPGAGTLPHIACEIVRRRFGFEATHVPFRGGAPALMAVASGDVDFSFFEPSNLATQLKAGTIRVIALGDTHRNAALPDTPTFAELGYPDLVFNSWTAAMAPKGTPPELVARLNAMFRAALATPEVVARFKALQIEIATDSPAELRTLQVSEIAERTPLFRSLGLIKD